MEEPKINLLVISPHFNLAKKELNIALRPYFKNVNIIIPTPMFSECIDKIFVLRRFFPFLENISQSYKNRERIKKSYDIDLFFPKYFTVPTTFFREQKYLHSSLSTIRILNANRIEFDLIHAHRMDLCGYIGTYVKTHYNKPLVFTTDGDDVYKLPFINQKYRSRIIDMLNHANHIIAGCQNEADKLIDLGFKREKITIIRNGFDENFFYPQPMNEARVLLGLPLDKKIILTIGTLHEVKGQIFLLKAMKEITKEKKDLLLLIIGSGPLEKEMREFIRRETLENNVWLVGYIPHNKIHVWINACDLFVLPSLNEGFPHVIPESMACGKPVVSTNVGGIPEIVNGEQVGLTINPGSSIELTESISYALEKKWNTDTIINQSRPYTLTSIRDQTLLVYENVLNH